MQLSSLDILVRSILWFQLQFLYSRTPVMRNWVQQQSLLITSYCSWKLGKSKTDKLCSSILHEYIGIWTFSDYGLIYSFSVTIILYCCHYTHYAYVFQSYPLCPYCYTNPPFSDMRAGFSCLECSHPTCKQALSQNAVACCVECEDGLMMIDRMSAPKWKLVCNK